MRSGIIPISFWKKNVDILWGVRGKERDTHTPSLRGDAVYSYAGVVRYTATRVLPQLNLITLTNRVLNLFIEKYREHEVELKLKMKHNAYKENWEHAHKMTLYYMTSCIAARSSCAKCRHNNTWHENRQSRLSHMMIHK